MDKVKVGITLGDINGIGLEVTLKALSDERILNQCTPIIYGNTKIVAYHKKVIGQHDLNFQSTGDANNVNQYKINVVNCWQDDVNIQLGQLTVEGGKYAYIALDRAVRDLKEGVIDVLVTAPINKKAMHLADFPHLGHTEYLGAQFDAPSTLMLMVDDHYKVALVTTHVPLREVPDLITKERVSEKLNILLHTLQRDFDIQKPHVAILGLNPHAGDDGTMGMEEDEVLIPLIKEMKDAGHHVSGPYSADGFFGSQSQDKFDAVLAMYHDQGLIPFKSKAFHSGVNVTAGLPVVRTSPDHGTAYEIAGKSIADPTSMRNSIYLAIDIYRNRKEYDMDRENVMRKNPKSSEDIIE